YLPGWPRVALSRSPGQAPPTLRSTRRIARPIVALARLPAPKALAPGFMPTARATGPFTTRSGAAMCVVACTPLRLKAGWLSASNAARTTGAYSGLQPAMTRLIANTSRLKVPCRGGILHSTSSGSPPSAATIAATVSSVGGTTGSPSVQPCSKYHSVRSVPRGTRSAVPASGVPSFMSGRRNRLPPIGGRIDRRVAGLDPHIDDCDAAALDHIDAGAKRADTLVRAADRAEPLGALAARQGRQIRFGIGDTLADPTVGGRPVALPRHAVLVQFGVEGGIVVGDDDEQRDPVMHRRPDRGAAHQEIAVAEHRNRQPFAVAQCQGGADRHARAAADPAAAIAAERVERMADLPGVTDPGERRADQARRTAAD